MNQKPASGLANPATPKVTCDLSQQLPELLMRAFGTITHDLNNALMVINSHCELLLDRMPPGDVRQDHVHRILNATRNAVKIGNTLNAFSRPACMTPEAIDFDATLAGLIPTLKGVAGKSRLASYSAGPGTKVVRLARGLVAQLILATVAAACDTAASTQCINVHTGLLRWLESNPDSRTVLVTGDYVWMSVAAEMSEANPANHRYVSLASVESRLASVRDLVRSFGGQIAVDNGAGVSITLYLPSVDYADDGHVALSGGAVLRGNDLVDASAARS